MGKAAQFPPALRVGIQGLNGKFSTTKATAALAGYAAAQPNTSQAPANRIGTNPNGTYAQLQRQRLSLEGERIIKNTPFAVNYVTKRMMYCSAGMSYAPDTGDTALDAAVLAYCESAWKRMGIECSMYEAYGRVADVFQPQSGDAALQWYRDENSLRLLEITADRIGNVYRYQNACVESNGLIYDQGLYLRGPNVVGYQLYDRVGDTIYTNPHDVASTDIIFFRDDITGGVRGVSKFFAALETVQRRYRILDFTMDTMQSQSKNVAIVSNNSGSDTGLTYAPVQNQNGSIEYVSSYADGACERYQFNGDDYEILKAEHPSEAFVNGMIYLDENASLAVGFPYSFLYSGAKSGGAPFRGDFEIAGKEITRLRNRYHAPRLDVISYVTIMDGVARGHLPAKAFIARGSWMWNSLPSVDSFRDDKSDIMSIRAGLTTNDAVIKSRGGPGYADVLRKGKQEAIMAAIAEQDANRELEKLGYKPTISAADIKQVTDNPQQGAQAEVIEQTGSPAPTAAPAQAA